MKFALGKDPLYIDHITVSDNCITIITQCTIPDDFPGASKIKPENRLKKSEAI